MILYSTRILFVLIPFVLATLYGFVRIFPATRGLYYRMPVLGLACASLGHLTYFILVVTGNTFEGVVSVGFLGAIGAGLFFLTQNLDPMASVMNEPTIYQKRNKYLALIAPAVILAVNFSTLWLWHKTSGAEGFKFWVGFVGVMTLAAVISAHASYYTFRAAISIDKDLGLIAYLRPYNIALTTLLVLFTAERYLRYVEVFTKLQVVLYVGFYIIMGINILVLLPLMERGRRRFLTLS